MIRSRVLQAAVAFLLFAGTAQAQLAQQVILYQGGAPGWVVGRAQGSPAGLDYDFANNRYYQQGQPSCTSPASCVTVVRANPPAYEDDCSGVWHPFAANVLRATCKGALIEESRTNDALWARDMTNAAWVKVGTAAALNATGIDGTANSASTLTAMGTAGSCTTSCTSLQTITLGSTADTYSVWLKRVSGSGAVNITINNLVGTTACTLTTTAFTQCQVTATLANPVVGIQMTTVGDVVVADVNQMEPGSFATSPIPTTSVAVTRAADVITVKTPPTFGSALTLFVSGTPAAPTSFGTPQELLELSDGTTSNRVAVVRQSASGNARAFMLVGSSDNYDQSGPSWAQSASGKMAASFVSGAQGYSFNGTEGSSGVSATFPVGLNTVNIGGNAVSGNQFNGAIKEIAIWPTIAQSSAFLQQVTK